MTPTYRLELEHQRILDLLTVLDCLAERIRNGERPLEQLAETLVLLQGFADVAHHGKEELHLFPALNRAGLPREGGPVAVMLLEHDAGRGDLDKMAAGLGELRRGVSSGVARLVEAAAEYSQLLRAHIAKENQVLFPIVCRLLPPDAGATLEPHYDAVDDETIGPGGYARVLARIDALVEAVVGAATPAPR